MGWAQGFPQRSPPLQSPWGCTLASKRDRVLSAHPEAGEGSIWPETAAWVPCSSSPPRDPPYSSHSPLDVGVIVLKNVIVVLPVLKNVFNETPWEHRGDKSAVEATLTGLRGQTFVKVSPVPLFNSFRTSSVLRIQQSCPYFL